MTTTAALRDVSPQSGGPATHAGPLTPDELTRIDAYWRAANYLSVGQIYLLRSQRSSGRRARSRSGGAPRLLVSRSASSTSSRDCLGIGGQLQG